MWNAKILNTTYGIDSLTVKMEYTNGTDTVSQIIDMTGGDVQQLHRKVASYLDTLNRTEELNNNLPPTGDFVPVVVLSPEEEFAQKVRELEKAQKAVDLGIIKTPDALTAAKTAVEESFTDPSLISSL